MRTSIAASLCRIACALGGSLLLACADPPPRLAAIPVRDPYACKVEHLEQVAGVDLAIAIDASRSTSRPSGHDVDQDGEVGVLFNAGTSDPLDSRLSAQVAAVRTLADALSGADVRMSIVSIRGRNDVPTEGREIRLVHWRRGAIRAPLTREMPEIERALDRLLARGGEGRTDFAAGMRLAVHSLLEAPEEPGRKRLIFLMSDSEAPMVAGPAPLNAPRLNTGSVYRADPRMRRAAIRARYAEAPIFTFALGPASDSAVPHALTRIAGATGGRYTPVDDLSRLHCYLIATLMEQRPRDRGAISQP